MAKKKLIINKEIKNNFITPNDNVENISLILNIDTETKIPRKTDFSKFLNYLSKEDKIKRRKELIDIISFFKNDKRRKNSLDNIIQRVENFIKDSDKNETLYFKDKDILFKALKRYSSNIKSRILNKELNSSSANTFRSQLVSFLIDCFGYEEKELIQYIPKINYRTDRLQNATILDSKGNRNVFTKDEYKYIIEILIRLSKHCDYLIENNIKGIEMKNHPFTYNDYNYVFQFSNNHLNKEKLQNNKSVFLLLAFICLTGSNLSPAITVKRKDVSVSEGERDLLNIRLTCYRKNKEQNHSFIIKKHQKKFFDYIIENSININPNSDSYLFPCINTKTMENRSLNESIIYYHYNKFNSEFPIKNKSGDILEISSRALRLTYASFFEDIDLRSAALFNSPKTAAKHYSNGNFEESNSNLQEAMNIYTLSLSNNENISKFKKEIDIKYIDQKDLDIKNIKLSNSGLICSEKNDKELIKYKRKLSSKGIKMDGELTCANIFACFTCENAILSNNFDSLYVLLSLKKYLEETLYSNEIGSLFSNKDLSKRTIQDIDNIFKVKIDKKLNKKLEKYIKDNGYHPLWSVE